MVSTSRDADIYARRNNGETLASISADYNISRERVRQICYEQSVLNRRKIVGTITYETPKETELYKWIMFQEYAEPCDQKIRVRAYNAIRLAWTRGNHKDINPNVEFLLSFDDANLRKLRGVGVSTGKFLITVRDAIIEDRAKRDEKMVSEAGRITYIGSDGNVYLRSNVSMEMALSRLYAYENSRLNPAEVREWRRELDKREGCGTVLKPLELCELRGMLDAEGGLFIEYRYNPERNGWAIRKNVEPKLRIEDYMIWWRAWPYEPTSEAIEDAKWKESVNEKIGA